MGGADHLGALVVRCEDVPRPIPAGEEALAEHGVREDADAVRRAPREDPLLDVPPAEHVVPDLERVEARARLSWSWCAADLSSLFALGAKHSHLSGHAYGTCGRRDVAPLPMNVNCVVAPCCLQIRMGEDRVAATRVSRTPDSERTQMRNANAFKFD